LRPLEGSWEIWEESNKTQREGADGRGVRNAATTGPPPRIKNTTTLVNYFRPLSSQSVRPRLQWSARRWPRLLTSSHPSTLLLCRVSSCSVCGYVGDRNRSVYGWAVRYGCVSMVTSHHFSAADRAKRVGQGQGCNAQINDIP
jgi:hypothetical protein